MVTRVVVDGDTYIHIYEEPESETVPHDAPEVDPETGETTAHHDENFTGELKEDKDFTATLDKDDTEELNDKRG